MKLPVPSRLLAAALVLASPLALATCGDSTAPATGLEVLVKDNFYQPSSLTIKPGEAVTWKWAGSVAHSVTFDDGAVQGSDVQAAGTITRTFTTEGTFNYHCAIHGASMSGSIVVTADSLSIQ